MQWEARRSWPPSRDTTHVMDITLERAAGGYTLTQTSQYVAPNHFRQEQETPFGRIVVYSDGTTGWIAAPDGTTPLRPDTLATVRGVLFRQPSGLMLSDRNSTRSVKALGPNVVEVTSADGQQVQIEFRSRNRSSIATVVHRCRSKWHASGAKGDILRLARGRWRSISVQRTATRRRHEDVGAQSL